VSYAVVDKWEPGTALSPLSDRILDKWIISRLQTLLSTTEKEMAQYHLYNVVPALLDFIEDLTNTYIRLNRKRFWSSDSEPGMKADKNAAYATLYDVLFKLTKVMAPFTPFLAEVMYKNLKLEMPGSKESVHLEDYPTANEGLISTELEKSVSLMNRVILMVRNIREKKNIKIKIPLKKLHIIHRDQSLLDHLKTLENYLKEELNVRKVDYLTNEDEFVDLSAKANGAVLGKRLGKKFLVVSKAIMSLDSDSLVKLEQGEMLEIEGETITKNECLIYRNAHKGHENVVSDAFITVELDTSLDEDQIYEGLAREVVNRVQKLRKTADLVLSDRIVVEYKADAELDKAIQNNIEYIKEQTLAVEFQKTDSPHGQASENCDIENKKLFIALTVSS